jgi:glycosyltransferase involved in cell wall biosynthesis
MLAIKHARRLGKPYAVEVAGCPWDGYFHHGALAARLYAPLGFLRMRRTLRSAPLALYVTSHWLQQRYPSNGAQASASNVELIPFTDRDVKRREKRLSAIAGGKKPVFGTVGSLRTRAKGIQVALAAVAKLRKSGFEVEYRVIGPGDPEPWIRLAGRLGVADLVHFDGVRTPGDGVAKWLDEIDVHLQPSFREGLPRATIEAMSRGVACIGSTCGGIPELLPLERLHAPGDTAALADRIRSLACDPQKVTAASKADREKARQFDPEELKRRRSVFFSKLKKRAELAAPESA